MFKFSKRSEENLKGVHPDLARVVRRAITISAIDFGITEGLRTQARQDALFKAKATKTLNSRHLTGHAIDVVAYVAGQVRWDWPLYHRIADAMKKAAEIEKVPLEWGGDWVSFKDGPHFQLPRKEYP